MIRDYGRITAVVGQSSIEFSFPYDAGIVSIMKEMRARWQPQRKCWVLDTMEKDESERQLLLESLGKRLLASAPEKWAERLDNIRQLCCVTRKYELVIAEGGIRLSVPPGHILEYRLKEVEGVQRQRQKFFLTPAVAMKKEMTEAIRRVVSEDRDIYNDWMEPSVGRTLQGNIRAQTFRKDMVNREKRLIYASRAFLKVVDSAFGDAPLSVFPFTITSLQKEGDSEVSMTLSYPSLGEGYGYLVDFYNRRMPPPVLTDTDIAGKWRIRSRM